MGNIWTPPLMVGWNKWKEKSRCSSLGNIRARRTKEGSLRMSSFLFPSSHFHVSCPPVFFPLLTSFDLVRTVRLLMPVNEAEMCWSFPKVSMEPMDSETIARLSKRFCVPHLQSIHTHTHSTLLSLADQIPLISISDKQPKYRMI